MISTSVQKVCLNFGKPNERAIDAMTVVQARQFIAAHHFSAGSMLPKIEACVQFVESGGSGAVITRPDCLAAALEGHTGTRILA